MTDSENIFDVAIIFLIFLIVVHQQESDRI